MRKRRVVGRFYGMKYSWKGHKDRNRHKNRIKRSGQARIVYVKDINCNIPIRLPTSGMGCLCCSDIVWEPLMFGEPQWPDPGLKGRIGVRELASLLKRKKKEKKAQARNESSNLPLKRPPPQPFQTTVRYKNNNNNNKSHKIQRRVHWRKASLYDQGPNIIKRRAMNTIKTNIRTE